MTPLATPKEITTVTALATAPTTLLGLLHAIDENGYLTLTGRLNETISRSRLQAAHVRIA